jgi:hypothetical protein
MRLIGFVVFLNFLFLLGCTEKKEAEQNMHNTQEQKMDKSDVEKIYYYTCLMDTHKHIHSDKPGKCPECNMHLVAAVNATDENKEYYGCPMETHSHIRHEQNGKCEECGMQLKPIRLVNK